MRLSVESVKCRGLLLVAISLLSACSGMTTSCRPPAPISAELTEGCPPYVLARDVGWQRAHELNTASAHCWEVQFKGLVQAVRAREVGPGTD